jgi:hypothetical protein
MATVADLIALTTGLTIPRTDIISFDDLHRPDLKDQLFAGQDAHCRFFVHIPVSVIGPDISHTKSRPSELTVYQVNPFRDYVFSVITPTYFIDPHRLLGAALNNFTLLEHLLNEKRLRLTHSDTRLELDIRT